MATIHERMLTLRSVPEEERENQRGELIDAAVQAVEAMEKRQGVVRPPHANALINRIQHLQAWGHAEVAQLLSDVRDAAGASMSTPGTWERLYEAARRTIEACAAGAVDASQRTLGRPAMKNHVLVEATGETRTFGLWHGDVTSFDKTDMIIASAYTKHDGAFSGQVVRELQRRFSVKLTYSPLLRLTEGASTTYLPAQGGAPAMIILSVPLEADGWSSDSWAIRYEPWVRGCFASLAALEVLGNAHHRVAMPVLFGNRKPPLRDTMHLMIRESAAWLRRSRACREVCLTVFLRDEVEAWSDAMDAVLGRVAVHAPDDAEVARHRKSILEWCAKASAEEVALIDQLRDALKNPDALSPQPICNAARQAGEALAKEWLRHLKKDKEKEKGPLQTMIETIQKEAPPMVVAHLQVLRVIGNAFSHHDAGLTDGGAMAALSFIAEALRSVCALLHLRGRMKP